MSTHAFFCDDDARPVTVEVRHVKGYEPKIVVALSVPFAVVDLHMDDLAAGYRLYQRLGNALQAARDAQDEASGGIDLASDPQPDGGTVGIQPGNPAMDTHGPRTEAPSAFVAGLVKASAAAEERRRRKGS